jgi:small subunit ribosomal protein S7
MSRRREVAKREILSDPRFNSLTVAKFINRVMLSGKKPVAEKIVYEALEIALSKLKTQAQIKKKSDEGEAEGGESGGSSIAASSATMLPVDVLELALENVRPMVEVRSRRVGGATYQVPVEVRPERRDTLAMRWLIGSARARSEKNMFSRLANELLDAIAGRGNSVKKREDVHKMAKANQAFAHFRLA